MLEGRVFDDRFPVIISVTVFRAMQHTHVSFYSGSSHQIRALSCLPRRVRFRGSDSRASAPAGFGALGFPRHGGVALGRHPAAEEERSAIPRADTEQM